MYDTEMNQHDAQIIVTSLYFRIPHMFRTVLVHLQEQHYTYIYKGCITQ